jgi:hypothetical protein
LQVIQKLAQLNKQLDDVSRNCQVVDGVSGVWEDAFRNSEDR